MSVTRQLILNNLSVRNRKLPMDVVEIIKSFAFDDSITALIKRKKRELVNVFKSALWSRVNIDYWSAPPLTEISEFWCFCSKENDVRKMYGWNCSYCGEYANVSNPRIMCICPPVSYDYDDE